jgi:N-acetylglucosamine kinase-like BadF-type ATPase
MREHFRLGSDLDVCAAVYGPPPMARSEFAALAGLVTQAARAGDGQARRVLQKAAEELAAIVDAVRAGLTVAPQVSLPVSYSGGMFRPDSVLTPLFEAELRKNGRRYEFAAPRLSPGAGAALYAAKLAGGPLTPEAVAQLASAHGAVHVEEAQ